jgi:predicted acylesterase/phospholipase RssA
MKDNHDNLSLVLSGGGAHAAYQVGFLRCLADCKSACNNDPFGGVIGVQY